MFILAERYKLDCCLYADYEFRVCKFQIRLFILICGKYNGIALLANRIFHEIWLPIGGVATRGTEITLKARLVT